MSARSNTNRLPIGDWEAESFRLTAFPVPASPVSDVGWWQSLVGQPPEVEVMRPREGGRTAEGPFETGRFILGTSPTRIDLRLIPSPPQEFTTIDLPTIGKFSEILGAFAAVTDKWLNLDSCPEIRRIAFGAVLLASVDSKASGYGQLAAYLPSVDIEPQRSADFLYQINRSRESTTGVANLTINRLAKWSVVTMSGGGLFLEPTGISYQENPQVRFACRVELDINTAGAGQEPLPRNRVSAILSELIDLGKEIVAEGDIP